MLLSEGRSSPLLPSSSSTVTLVKQDSSSAANSDSVSQRTSSVGGGSPVQSGGEETLDPKTKEPDAAHAPGTSDAFSIKLPCGLR